MSRFDRRQLLALGGAAAVGPLLPSLSAASPGASALGTTPETRSGDLPFRLGVATYSLRKLSRPDAIAAIQALGTPWVNVKSFHLPEDATPTELAAGRKEFEDAGLTLVGGGTITLAKDDDESIGTAFEYARNCGFPLIVIAPRPENLARIETFVKRYDIQVAIHNHGPEDKYFPGPRDIVPLIRDMDPRVGVCVDVGHTARTGVDVVQAIADAGDRVLDLHMKDLRDLASRDSQCIVGEGRMPVAGIFEQLAKMGYTGCVNLEYEIDADDPLPGMVRSFAYMRGIEDGLLTRA